MILLSACLSLIAYRLSLLRSQLAARGQELTAKGQRAKINMGLSFRQILPRQLASQLPPSFNSRTMVRLSVTLPLHREKI